MSWAQAAFRSKRQDKSHQAILDECLSSIFRTCVCWAVSSRVEAQTTTKRATSEREKMEGPEMDQHTFRSIKRAKDMFVSDYGKRPAESDV